MGPQINVVIVDCHNLVSEGLALILSAEDDLQVVGAFNHQANASQLTTKIRPHVVILDANLAGVEAITRQLVATHPPPRILILATECHTQQALDLLSAGATSYLCKHAAPQDLVAAVRHTNQQEMVLDPAVARSVVDQLTHSGSQPIDTYDDPQSILTDREYEVLQLMCRGFTDKEIARQLSISIRTVNGHLRHIYAKIGLHSRTETMHLALEKGWVTLAITGAILSNFLTLTAW